MGTTAQKGAYLNQTKMLLKDKINALGGDIDDETTFREYANQLDEIYDHLPKTSFEEGTDITLENCLKAKLDFDDDKVGFGQISQESTQGYQLISLKDGTYTGNSGVTIKVENGKCTLNGTPSASEVIPVQLKDNLSLTNGQTYTLYGFNDVANSNVAFRPRIDEGFFQVAFDTTNKVESKTYNGTSTSVASIGIKVGGDTTITNLVCKPMLISGNDTTKSYEKYTGGQASPNPDYPQNINVVTGTQDVVVSGKNLFDDSNHKNKNVPSSAGFYISNAPFNLSGGTYRFGVFVDNQLITTPALMALSFKSGGTTVLEKNAPNQDITITDEQASIIDRVSLYFNGTFVSTYSGKKITGVMITTSEITTYEPYYKLTKQVHLGEIELCGIGDYKDYFVTDRSTKKWYIHKAIGEKIFTGASEENWNVHGSIASWFFYDDLVDGEPLNTSTTNAKSNYYKQRKYNEVQELINGEFAYGYSSGTTVKRLVMKNTDCVSVNDFKTWLSNHHTSFCYPLAQAVETEIPDGTLKTQLEALYNAQSIKGTTIIKSNGDLPIIIKTRALKGAA